MNIDTLLISLYISLFGRVPEYKGFSFWKNLYQYKHLSLDKLVNNMLSTVSSLAKKNHIFAELYPQYMYIDTNNYSSIRNLIEYIYKNIFNKDYTSDPEGINYWSSLVINQQVPISKVILNIVNTALSKDWSYNVEAKKAYLTLMHRVDLSKYALNKILDFQGSIYPLMQALKITKDTSESLENAKNYIDKLTEGLNQECNNIANFKTDYLSPEIKSLIYGTFWNTNTISYSFPKQIPDYYINYFEFSLKKEFSNLNQLINSWMQINDSFKKVIKNILNDISKQINLTFIESPNGAIKFNTATFNPSELGFTFMPDKCSPFSGDIFLNKPYLAINNQTKYVIIHELGHALGLKHPFEGNYTLPDAEDNTLYTVMSYTPYKPYVIDVTSENGEIRPILKAEAFPITYQMLDIKALQKMYGFNNQATIGNDYYNLGKLYNNKVYYTLWDAGGIDTLDVSKTIYPSYINLNPGNFSSVGYHSLNDIKNVEIKKLLHYGFDYTTAKNYIDSIIFNSQYKDEIYTGENNLAIAYGTIIENLITGDGDDEVIDNKANNSIYTNGGNDIIIIQQGGNDCIDGGSGYDTLQILDYYTNCQIDLYNHEIFSKLGTIHYTDIEEIDFLDKVIYIDTSLL